MRCWSCSDVCIADFGNTAPSALCLPSADAFAEWGMQFPPDLLCMKGEFIFWFHLISVFTGNDFAVWLGRRNEHVFVHETSKINGFLSLLQKLVKSCLWLWKLFSGTLLACRSELEQQVLTTGFPPTLMPLWFAGFGNCFCLPAFHSSPQHMGPSCDFRRMRRWPCSVLLKLL